MSLIQRRLSPRRVFFGAMVGGGVLLIGAATMSTLVLASLWIAGFGLCAGTVYVLGFSMLQGEVSDELRGRIFATLYAATRLCLFLALVVAPVVATVLDGLSRSLVGPEGHGGGSKRVPAWRPPHLVARRPGHPGGGHARPPFLPRRWRSCRGPE